MTPQQAVSVLDQVTAMVSLNRKDHETVMEALRTLSEVIAEQPKAEKPKEE